MTNLHPKEPASRLSKHALHRALLYLLAFPGGGLFSLVLLFGHGDGKSLTNLGLEPSCVWLLGAALTVSCLVVGRFYPGIRWQLAISAASLALLTALLLHMFLPGLPE